MTNLKRIILATSAALLSVSAIAAGGCRAGYSQGSLAGVKNDYIEARFSEVRARGLLYVLDIEISKKEARQRSANTTIHIVSTLEASSEADRQLSELSHLANSKQLTSVCVKTSSALPDKFTFSYGTPVEYELDIIRPIPVRL